jgi:hypothetical protein
MNKPYLEDLESGTIRNNLSISLNLPGFKKEIRLIGSKNEGDSVRVCLIDNSSGEKKSVCADIDTEEKYNEAFTALSCMAERHSLNHR